MSRGSNNITDSFQAFEPILTLTSLHPFDTFFRRSAVDRDQGSQPFQPKPDCAKNSVTSPNDDINSGSNVYLFVSSSCYYDQLLHLIVMIYSLSHSLTPSLSLSLYLSIYLSIYLYLSLSLSLIPTALLITRYRFNHVADGPIRNTLPNTRAIR